jgi:site-specific DNA-methyltransferase (adenine-specific)
MADKPDKYYDLAIVDPPYGIGVNKMTLGNGKNKIYRGINNWDETIPCKKYWDELFRVSKNQIIWGGNYFTEYLKPMSSWLFWDKGTGGNDFADGELAWSSFGGALRKISKSWVGANAKNESKRIHPTEKPVLIYEYCLMNYAKPGDKILDTHGGSGSICIACHNLGFDLDWCELDAEYFEEAKKRFDIHKAQLRIFQ